MSVQDVIEKRAPRPGHVPVDREVDYDVYYDPALRHDVHGRMAEMRAGAANVAWTPRNGGHWMVFGREELERVLSGDPAFSSRQLSLEAASGSARMIPLSLDPPEHAPYRLLLLKYLGPKEIRGLEPFVRDWTERTIAKVEGRTSCDFIHDVAEIIPVSVFMALMGMPLDRFDEFRGLAAAALNPNSDMADRMTLNMRIFGVLAELIAAKRAQPADDLISHLLADTIEGRPLTEDELFSICFLLFLAGLDTVINATGYGMRHLALHPEDQARLRADPAAIPQAVEDFMRRYTFVNTVRVATRDVELGGVTIHAGEALCCVLWSGSNDPGAHGHMGFGSGPHLCLGIHLARLEMRVIYETWLKRIGPFALAEDDPAVMHGGSVMGMEKLPLVLAPQ